MIVINYKEAIGPVQDGRYVGGQQRHAVGRAHNQRGDPASRNNHVGLVTVHHGECEGTTDFIQGGPDGLQQIESALAPLFNTMRQYFGIGGRGEDVAPFAKLSAEFLVVLDDAVVNQSNRTGTVHVGVGIFFARGSVGGPASVTNPGRTVGWGRVTVSHQGGH